MDMAATLSLPSIPTTSLSFASCNSLFFNNSGGNLLKTKNKSYCLTLSKTRTQRGGFNCRCLFGLGVPELVVIAGVAALVFGTKRLPEVGRNIGKTVKSFQQAAKEFESELKKETEPTIRPTLENPAAVSEEEKQDVKVSSTKENS